MTEICQRCKESGEELRTLSMSCFYDMKELGLPFTQHEDAFTLRVCQTCRKHWMKAIQQWFMQMN